MTTEDALLAAVLAAPDDDLPRLVLADHYEGELGQPERAEFIRVQCELSRGESLSPFRLSMLLLRQRNLLGSKSCLDWFAMPGTEPHWTASDGFTGWRANGSTMRTHVRRGFVSQIHCTLADWCGGRNRTCTRCNYVAGHPWEDRCPSCNSHRLLQYPQGIGPQIVRRHPVERVVLTDREPRGPLHDAPDLYVWRVTGVPISDGADIPADITRHLAGGKTAASWQRIYYPTREDALASLSAAAIAWAKAENERQKRRSDDKTGFDRIRAAQARLASTLA